MKRSKKLIETMLYVAAGCFLGIFTGLAPGIHINTVSIILLQFYVDKNPNLAFLIVSMSIVHNFVDFIPSILLGAPNSENFLSILPGHRLLLEGKGHYAIKLAIFGSLIGSVFSIIFAPIYFLFIEDSMFYVSANMHWILAGVLLLMVFSEKGFKKIHAAIIIFLSAVVGLIGLQGHVQLNEPLFAVITGFFGIPTLIESISKSHKIKLQPLNETKLNSKKIFSSSILGILAGSIVSLLPSVGPNQSTFLISKLFGKIKTSNYMVILGAVNSSNMVFSFFALNALGKGRSGSAAIMSQIIEMNEMQLWQTIAIVLIAAGFGVFATNFLAKILLNKIQRADYKKLNFGIICLLALLVFAVSGIMGLVFLITTSAIGLLSIKFGIKRTNCMAFLIVPTIIIYLKLNGIF